MSEQDLKCELRQAMAVAGMAAAKHVLSRYFADDVVEAVTGGASGDEAIEEIAEELTDFVDGLAALVVLETCGEE